MTIRIGIDPGSRTGVAAMRGDKLLSCRTFGWRKDRDALEGHLAHLCAQHPGLVAFVEEPRGTVYPRGLSPAAQAKVGKDVGQCLARAREIARYLDKCGAQVHLVPPLRNGTKWAEKMWRGVFQWTKRLPSNHARDAACLALLARVPLEKEGTCK